MPGLQEETRLFDFFKIEKDHPFYCNTNTNIIVIFKVVTTDTSYKDKFCALRSEVYASMKPHTQLIGEEREEKNLKVKVKKLQG